MSEIDLYQKREESSQVSVVNTVVLVFTLCLLIGGSGLALAQDTKIPLVSQKPITEKRRSVIIYPLGFEEAAKNFAYLHREFGGTEAIVVSLEQIRKATGKNLKIHIPFDGWENKRPKRIRIRNYDYDLAKRIIAYLQELEKRHEILAVLLLGDGEHIPPSYYFHVPYMKRIKGVSKPYNEWIASDILYGSPDLDFVHEWAVGRISVDTSKQAQRVAGKYYRWFVSNKKKKNKSFIYFGGNIRHDMAYSGELLFLMLEEAGVIGEHIIHYFESDKKYTIEHLENSFLSDQGYLHYIFSHGSGDGFGIKGKSLHSHEIAKMPYKDGLPLVVSSSCLDGGFDYDLIDAPHDFDGYSIGEAILRSPGAGIGYLGSSRVSLGQFHYRLYDGEISPHSMLYRYMPGLLFEFLKSYHSGSHRLADAYVEAHDQYRKLFGIKKPQDFATFVELNLLADPVTILPEPQVVSHELPHLEIVSEHRFRHGKVLVPIKKIVQYRMSKESPFNSLEVTIVNVRTGHVLLKKQVTKEHDLKFIPPQKRSFLLRVDFPDNTVNWQYFQSDKF